MASHPYISGAGNVAQMIAQLRKVFPSTVTSETIKKYGIASNNESYVINALQFIGVIDPEGKKTQRGAQVFAIHSDQDFATGFEGLIRDSYKDLFEHHGEEAWALERDKLIGYFRTTDQTSEIVGSRQAGVFKAFAALAGHGDGNAQAKPKSTTKPKERAASPGAQKKKQAGAAEIQTSHVLKEGPPGSREMALTVRIEINLPADGSRETYDNIFQSIRTNLLND